MAVVAPRRQGNDNASLWPSFGIFDYFRFFLHVLCVPRRGSVYKCRSPLPISLIRHVTEFVMCSLACGDHGRYPCQVDLCRTRLNSLQILGTEQRSERLHRIAVDISSLTPPFESLSPMFPQYSVRRFSPPIMWCKLLSTHPFRLLCRISRTGRLFLAM